MASSNLEALNELIQKIKAGEGTAESNLEALNMLCVIAGGTGTAKSNLEALNELLTVFSPGGETQEKSVRITANGTTQITPDEGYTLSKAVVVTDVPGKPEQTKSVTITENGASEIVPAEGFVLSKAFIITDVPTKPEQTKAVTITENGTTEITPDGGKVLSGVSVSVNVSGGSDYNTKINSVNLTGASTSILMSASKIDLSGVAKTGTANCFDYLFYRARALKDLAFGDFLHTDSDSVTMFGIFEECNVIENVDLSSLGAKKITKLSRAFVNCYVLKNINFGNAVLQVADYDSAFSGCKALESIDLSGIDHTYTGTTKLNYMFSECSKLTSVDLSNLNTSKLYSQNNAFWKCTALTNIVFEDNCFPDSTFWLLELSSYPISHDSIITLFNRLATRDNSPSLKLSTATKGYLTDDEIAIAANKGWVIS